MCSVRMGTMNVSWYLSSKNVSLFTTEMEEIGLLVSFGILVPLFEKNPCSWCLYGKECYSFNKNSGQIFYSDFKKLIYSPLLLVLCIYFRSALLTMYPMCAAQFELAFQTPRMKRLELIGSCIFSTLLPGVSTHCILCRCAAV